MSRGRVGKRYDHMSCMRDGEVGLGLMHVSEQWLEV